MGAAYFYHLTQSPIETTLMMLLIKAREAGWPVHVRSVSDEGLKWLDEKLWLGTDTEFLAHGVAGGEQDEDQPVLLSAGEEAGNQATCLMSVFGADISAIEVREMQRVCVLFDGNDAVALDTARRQWKNLSDAGCAAQYWSQEGGKWEMRAENSV